LHPNKDFSVIVQVLVRRYKDRLKHEKAFQRLNTVRQGDRTVKELNQKFTAILIDLEPRSIETALIWYDKMTFKWEFIELLRERKLGDVEEAMRRIEEKEQKKLTYKAVYGGKITPKVEESTASAMDIGKRKVTCGYCEKLNHTVNVCRKKLVRIKLVSREELKEKGLCFKCGQEGHMV
jgi:hypothetical protein